MSTPLLDIDGLVINRRFELKKLRAAAETAERDGGVCVLLSGVPGVGKSTLMQSFGGELSTHNCIFAYSRCRNGAPAPYSAVAELLASIVGAMESTTAAERDRWRADLTGETSPLAGILGELVPGLIHALGEVSRCLLSMPPKHAADCIVPQSDSSRSRRPTGRWCWRSTISSGPIRIRCHC